MGMVVHSAIPALQEAEAEGSQIQTQGGWCHDVAKPCLKINIKGIIIKC